MTATRIYSITPTAAAAKPEPRLVEASSQGQALRHVTGSMFKVETVSAKEAVDAIKSGIQVEVANAAENDLQADKDWPLPAGGKAAK